MKFVFKRFEYKKNNLELYKLGKNPLKNVTLWILEAANKGIKDPNAAVLATAGCDLRPTSRTVLIKEADTTGLFFYTNLKSLKSKNLSENPYASITFFWRELERQITLTGKVKQVSKRKAAEYFKTRPRKNQLAAWASMQGNPLNSKDELLKAFKEKERRFHGKQIPLPSHWGGFKLIVETADFWQGGESRLHDRFLFVKQNKGWKTMRIYP